MEVGQIVKFNKKTRYFWDPDKGDLGTIVRVLGTRLFATDDIYIVRVHANANDAWVQGNELVPWNQLQLPI